MLQNVDEILDRTTIFAEFSTLITIPFSFFFRVKGEG